MLKSCIQKFLPIHKLHVNATFAFNNVTNWTTPLLRFSSVLAGHNNPTPKTFLRTNEVNILSVRTKKNMKAAVGERYRVLIHDRDTGMRTSCDEVTTRFFRLRWGMWIRTIENKDKKLYKKRSNRLRRNRQHVMISPQRCKLLDRLAGPWYRKPHYYVDDPYEPYHEREEFLYTRRRPLPPS